VLIALTSINASASDKITLACSGTLWTKDTGGQDIPIPSASFVIDLDGGTVTSSIGAFSIDKTTENLIGFIAPQQDGLPWQGSVDRFTGHVSVMQGTNRQVIMVYNLNCKRANAIF
jgi:hypothetical protein